MELQISASPVYDDAGQITRVIQVMQDVTKNRLLEKLILDAKKEWECVVDASEDGMLLLGEKGCLLRANKAFFKMVGSIPEELVGRKIHNVFSPGGETVDNPIFTAIEEKQDTVVVMENGHPCNPTESPIEFTLKGIKNDQGCTTSFFMRLHDLTVQRETERELRRSSDRWERTFNAFTDVVTLLDLDMRVVRVNTTGSESLKLSVDQIIGKRCYELFQGCENPCEDCPLYDTQKNFEPFTKEITSNRLGRTFLVSASPVTDDKGNVQYVAHVAKDITKQRKIEEALSQSLKMEAIGSLAGGIAHDFNNILSAIIGYAEFAEEEVPRDSQASKDIKQVINSSLRAKELIRQLLDFSRRSPRKKKLVEPGPVVKDALNMMKSTIPASITLKDELNCSLGNIRADPIGLQQIVLNLCTNAMHSLEDRKGTITVRLSEVEEHASEFRQDCVKLQGPFVLLTVEDTGCGMDKPTVDKIFEPYFTTKAPGKGSGMGLSVIHGIAREFGGCIHVASSPGKGTVFSVYFPFTGVKPSYGSLRTQVGGAGIDLPVKRRILVIDDEPMIVRVHQRQLESRGYEVTAETDSKKAFEMIRSKSDAFDLVITDQNMPVFTGEELAEKIIKINPSMPIILCTAHSESLSEEKALDLGIRKYVSLPIHKDELVDAVREVLGEASQGRPAAEN